MKFLVKFLLTLEAWQGTWLISLKKLETLNKFRNFKIIILEYNVLFCSEPWIRYILNIWAIIFSTRRNYLIIFLLNFRLYSKSKFFKNYQNKDGYKKCLLICLSKYYIIWYFFLLSKNLKSYNIKKYKKLKQLEL